MKVFAIIVTYNGAKWIEKCLTSLINSSIKTKIIVIDNFSKDNTIEIIKENFPEILLINSEENLGFAKANNLGIRYSLDQGADFFFLLNQDAWIENDTIEKMINAFEIKKDAGIVSPIHTNGSKTNLDSAFVNYIANQYTPHFISDLYFNKLSACYETNFINAACWLISRNCIEKVGGFDTSIFYHYGEDENYCQRVIYHGFKIYVVAITTICHDREDRGLKRIEENEKRRNEVKFVTSHANLLLEEEDINNVIRHYKRRINILYLIYKLLIFKLKVKKVLEERGSNKKSLDLLYKIKNSRKINKQGGLLWL